jgi:hypothetical protein
MADSDAVDSLHSTGLMCPSGSQSNCAPKIRAWSFLLTNKADFAGAVDQGQRLKEHISVRTVAERPWYVTLQIAFYDTSLLSAVPDSDGLVSIALHGYVQTENGTRVSTIQKWIRMRLLKPKTRGLASIKKECDQSRNVCR